MKSVTEQIVKYSPNAIILVLTNPLIYDVTYIKHQFPKEKVILIDLY